MNEMRLSPNEDTDLLLCVFPCHARPLETFIILFLEAKTEVTKITGIDQSRVECWERGVKWFARFWAYVSQ